MKYSELKTNLMEIPVNRVSVLPVDSLQALRGALLVSCVCHPTENRYTLYMSIYRFYCQVVNTSSGYFLKVQKKYNDVE
jgi:hypothetical protein